MTAIGADFELDPAYQLELLKGTDPTKESVFRKIFKPQQVGTMSGSVPFIPDKYTKLSTDPNEHTSVGIQDDPDVFEVGNSAADFKFDSKYAKEAKIHKTKVATLANIKGGEDLVQYLGAVAKGMVNEAVDMDGATVLKSTTLNDTIAATAGWSSGNQDIFADIDAMLDALGFIDVLWLGVNKVREMMQDDAFKAEVKNYAASAARVGRQHVIDTLKEMYEITDVVIDGVWYNAENVKQDISRARIFDDVVWGGRRDHMIVVDRPDLMEADNEYKSRSGNYHEWITEYVDIARADKAKGIVLTGS